MTAQKQRPARYATRETNMKTPVEIFVTSSEASDESMDVLQRAIAEGKLRELRINGEIVLTPPDTSDDAIRALEAFLSLADRKPEGNA
jgi:hypothetical protein